MTSPRLSQRIDLFAASPTAAELDPETYDALRARLLAARTYAELNAADRQLIQQGVLQMHAFGAARMGASPGDARAVDAALDAEDDEALEAALDTVAAGPHGWGEPPLSDIDSATGDLKSERRPRPSGRG